MAAPVLPSLQREESRDQRALARQRIGFLTSERWSPDAVRPSIVASWRRSRDLAVPPDGVSPLEAPELELDTPLSRAAVPVLKGLAAVLDGQPISVILTDRRGAVLSRLTADHALEQRLDAIGLTPGFDYGERSMGTNGIGTALEVGAPTHVFGHEHFAQNLEDLACAGVPIRHPVTGRTVGLVDLTCWQRHAGSLLTALAATTAHQVQDALMNQSTLHERNLLDEYVRTCRRAAGIVLAVGDSVTMLNDYSRDVLSSASQEHLLRRATEAMSEGARPTSLDVELPGGEQVRMLLHYVGDRARHRSVVVRVVPRDGRSVKRRRPRAGFEAKPLPGLVGSGPVWLRACAAVEETFRSGEWLAVTGERGVGKGAILRAVQLRSQPVPRLTVLDAGADDVDDWIDRMHDALDSSRANLLLLNLDRLDARLLRLSSEILRARRTVADPAPPWVAVTLTEVTAEDSLVRLLDNFPVTVHVPPLRLHPDDVMSIVLHFTRRAVDGRRLTWSEDALQVLARATWPGNVAQLHEVVRRVISHRRSGVIGPDDLPSEVRSVSRRALSVIESMEREAIVDALADAHGDKTAAAAALGLSRATIYRRIRAFGIVDTVT